MNELGTWFLATRSATVCAGTKQLETRDLVLHFVFRVNVFWVFFSSLRWHLFSSSSFSFYANELCLHSTVWAEQHIFIYTRYRRRALIDKRSDFFFFFAPFQTDSPRHTMKTDWSEIMFSFDEDTEQAQGPTDTYDPVTSESHSSSWNFPSCLSAKSDFLINFSIKTSSDESSGIFNKLISVVAEVVIRGLSIWPAHVTKDSFLRYCY